jgi:hypothetical protein
MKLSKEETLKKLQELQLKYLGEVDMNVRYEIETRKDQKCTMVISYCNYTENFEKKSKLFIHKFYWDQDNSFEFKQMELEIEELRKAYK